MSSEPQLGQILVVDDEPYVLKYLVRALTGRGHRVNTASDGEAALKAVHEGGYDLILSDLSMPDMDGVDLLRAVRKRDRDVPVILLTGNPDVASAAQAVEHGAFRYLMKPLRDTELHTVVLEGLRYHDEAKRKRRAMEAFEQLGGRYRDRMAVANELDAALGAMWMAYQPIYHAREKKLFAHEALLRSSYLPLAHPGAMLHAAESLGRLSDVGSRVREHVAAQAVAQPRATLFVNLHAADLLDEALYLPDAPLSKQAERVVLEITERAALESVDDVLGRVRRLRDLGFKLAVDDLGSGYAGLNSFAQISPNFVKLDMSLVRNVHQQPLKQRLVRSLTSVCQEMGILVVAEGVETTDEKETLVGLGCDLLQGYLLGRPAPELVP